MEINSSELSVLVREIKSKILEAAVRNVYHLKDDSTVMKLATENMAYELRIIPASCLYVTEESLPKPDEPTKYAQSLRRYINNTRVKSFSQLDTERIAVIELESKTSRTVRIYAELLPPGNVILAGENDDILECLREVESKSRLVKVGSKYSPPPSRFSYTPGTLPEDLFKLLRQDSPVVAALSRDLGLGGKYAEELLHRAGVEKSRKVKELDESERQVIVDMLREFDLEMRNPSPLIYVQENEVVPSIIRLKKLEDNGYRRVEVREFNEAVKLAYEYHERLKRFEELRKPIEEEITQLKKVLGEKEYVIQQITEKSKQLEEKINILNQHTGLVENLRIGLIKKTPQQDYRDIRLVKIDEKNRRFTVNIEGLDFDFAIDISTWKQLGSMYDELKAVKNTIGKLRNEQSSLLAKLSELENKLTRIRPDAYTEIEERTSITIDRGFKRVRRFVTSEGFEVLAGKDASSNIALIRKHMANSDLVFHAEIRGSPVAILKRGSAAGEASIEEAAQFTACFSRAWREGLSSATVYYVKPEQVSLSPPPGQYLPKGSFMVYGRRNYLTTELALAANIEKHGNRVVVKVIPKLTAERQGIKYVEIRPGGINAFEASKKIIEFFKIELPQRIERELADLLASMIPYGRCHVMMRGHT